MSKKCRATGVLADAISNSSLPQTVLATASGINSQSLVSRIAGFEPFGPKVLKRVISLCELLNVDPNVGIEEVVR